MRKSIRDMSTDEIKLRLAMCEKRAPKQDGKLLFGLRTWAYKDALAKRR